MRQMPNSRKSGIDVLEGLPWGSHLCNFYSTKEDLLDLMVPFIKAGLENNEFCMCVIAGPSTLLTVEGARTALQQSIPDLEDHIRQGRLEIVSSEDWFFSDGIYYLREVMNRFVVKLNAALA